MSAVMRWEELIGFIKEEHFKACEFVSMDSAPRILALSSILKKAKALEDRDYSESLTEAGY